MDNRLHLLCCQISLQHIGCWLLCCDCPCLFWSRWCHVYSCGWILSTGAIRGYTKCPGEAGSYVVQRWQLSKRQSCMTATQEFYPHQLVQLL